MPKGVQTQRDATEVAAAGALGKKSGQRRHLLCERIIRRCGRDRQPAAAGITACLLFTHHAFEMPRIAGPRVKLPVCGAAVDKRAHPRELTDDRGNQPRLDLREFLADRRDNLPHRAVAGAPREHRPDELSCRATIEPSRLM